jgi:hypothetical protein
MTRQTVAVVDAANECCVGSMLGTDKRLCTEAKYTPVLQNVRLPGFVWIGPHVVGTFQPPAVRGVLLTGLRTGCFPCGVLREMHLVARQVTVVISLLLRKGISVMVLVLSQMYCCLIVLSWNCHLGYTVFPLVRHVLARLHCRITPNQEGTSVFCRV